jgi:hypothetical protein
VLAFNVWTKLWALNQTNLAFLSFIGNMLYTIFLTGKENGLLENPVSRSLLVQEGCIICPPLQHGVASMAFVCWNVHLRELFSRLLAQKDSKGKESIASPSQIASQDWLAALRPINGGRQCDSPRGLCRACRKLGTYSAAKWKCNQGSIG